MSQKLSIRAFLTIGPYEKDPEFRELLRSIGAQGLFVYGLLGSGMIITFVLAHIFIRGMTMTWDYTTLNPEQHILMYDKVVILAFCLCMIYSSYTSLSLRWIRLQVLGLVWIACMAMLLDDVVAHDVSFNTAYTTIVLMFSIAVVPFAGWQTGLISIIVILSTVGLLEFVPVRQGLEPLQLKVSQVIYISIISAFLTGMSSQIYINRYRQYRARKRAEELSRKLKDRAYILERLKEKADYQAEKLRETEVLKDRFFANISHEFRTPLTVILGPLKDMLEDEDNQQWQLGRNMTALMYRNGQRLLSLINQLLELSKIDAGRIRLDRTTLNLNNFVKETVLEFVPLAESNNVELLCELPEYPVHVQADLEQMERVIGNLVSNAIKFTPEGGRVDVSVTLPEDEQQAEVVVRDTGIGIPVDELPYIFDRFYQATHDGKRIGTGTGIGLALAKEIVELHGGHLQVSSKQGSGTEFLLTLATTEGGSPEHAYQPTSSHTLVDGSSFKKPGDIKRILANGENPDRPAILMIDDNPDILTYLRTHLSDRYNLYCKEDSGEALELLKKRKIDLVISDVMMPPPDGFELCRIIKEDPKLNHIPIILLTAQASEESRIEGLEHGADDYISKPFSASELLVRVENLIELRRTLREKYSEQVRLKGKQVAVTSEDARFLKQVQAVIEQQMENSNFSVDWLADEVNLSARQLQRKIRSVTDLSAGGYIRMMRLERARQLLDQQWGNISEVAYKVGFQDAKYFSRLFKQTFGETPSAFMEKEG